MTEHNNIWSLYYSTVGFEYDSQEKKFFKEHMIKTRKSIEGNIKNDICLGQILYTHSYWGFINKCKACYLDLTLFVGVLINKGSTLSVLP